MDLHLIEYFELPIMLQVNLLEFFVYIRSKYLISVH